MMVNYRILEDIYIGFNSIIFDKGKSVLGLHPFYQDHINKESGDFNNHIVTELPSREYVDLTHYYGYPPFAHRYDVLSRIRHIESIITDNTYFLIGLDVKGFTRDRFNEEFELFGIKNKVFFPAKNVLFGIGRLIYPYWLYKSDRGNESPVQFTEESFSYCRNKYQEYFKKSNSKYKLFLTRFNIGRSIINFEEVHNFFRDNGFVIVDGSEDLRTTIEYFHNAQIIIGIHGGIFSNLIFCDEMDKVIEIFPKEYYNGCFLGWKRLLNIKGGYDTLIFESTNRNIFLEQKDLVDIVNRVKL